MHDDTLDSERRREVIQELGACEGGASATADRSAAARPRQIECDNQPPADSGRITSIHDQAPIAIGWMSRWVEPVPSTPARR